MAFPNIFTKPVVDELIGRINNLKPDSQRQWGKMSADQMLAHCNVAYEMVYDNNHPKPNFLARFFIKTFAKGFVTGDKPYKKNGPTGPGFIIEGSRDFEKEKARLIGYLERTQQLGEAHFDNKESHSFGKLNINEWNTMFYKHLDHHLTQFGV